MHVLVWDPLKRWDVIYLPSVAILSIHLAQSRNTRCLNKANVYTLKFKNSFRSIPKIGEGKFKLSPSWTTPLSRSLLYNSIHLPGHRSGRFSSLPPRTILPTPLQRVRSVTFVLKLWISADLWVMWVTQGPFVGGGDETSWFDMWLYFHTRVSCKQMGPLTRGLIEIVCHGGGSSVWWIRAQRGARLPAFQPRL